MLVRSEGRGEGRGSLPDRVEVSKWGVQEVQHFLKEVRRGLLAFYFLWTSVKAIQFVVVVKLGGTCSAW